MLSNSTRGDSAKKYLLQLERDDVLLLLDALKLRKESWENTLVYARGEQMDPEAGLIEEFRDVGDVESVACHYRDVIMRVERQFHSQPSEG